MSYYNTSPNRHSMYSPPPQNGPPPPQRPYSTIYQPASNNFVQPPPPPRPSSAYIAPFPGQEPTYQPPYPLASVGNLPNRYSSLTPIPNQPLYQPQPVSLVAPPDALSPRTTSLGQGGPSGGYDEGNYDNTPSYDYNSSSYPPPTPADTPYQGSRLSTTQQHNPNFNETTGPNLTPAHHHSPSIASAFSALSINTQSSDFTPDMQHQVYPSSSSSSLSSASATEPPRTYILPTVENLQSSASTLDSAEDIDQILWAQDVLRLVDRQLAPSGNGGPTDFTHPDSPPPNTSKLPPALIALLENAVPIIIVVSTSPNSKASALAIYLKARLLASGLCPDMLPKSPRQAFKDFETAARAGEIRGWFRLGRDYEGVNDLSRAKDCYERGLKRGDCECTYRMGMAHLLGQLNLPINPSTALTLLRQASDLSTIDFPQPSYVYGMLLAGELSVPTEIPSSLVLPSNSIPNEALYIQWGLARESIEKSAYLLYPPAQYKAGHLYEHAELGTFYDPLVSVNWYTFASKNGEKEADMALSKWFLCGAEGHFPKNENLARTFAEKAARKNHPNGCFALGYYYETGVGGRKDLDQARKWYQKAANLGNTDAPLRLSALSAPVPTSISMAEHETRLNDTLVRRRTQAKIRSDRQSISRPTRRRNDNQNQNQNQNQYPSSQPPQVIQMPQAFSPRPQEWDNPQNPRQPSPINMPTPLPMPSASPSPMSPAIRVGEIMSPNPNMGYGIPTSNSFPSRPPIPHQSFNQQPNQNYENQTFPNNRRNQQGYNNAGAGGGRIDENGNNRNRRPSGVSNSTSLSDLPLPEERRGSTSTTSSSNNRPPKKEAQTFAEMGFQSKPVEEDGCLMM